MPAITLKAHFDGETVQLDEQCDIPRNARLLVTVLPSDDDQEASFWRVLSAENLARAYSNEEPDYTIDMVRERNPGYEGR